MNPNDLKCRAKDLNGNVVEGWYAEVGEHWSSTTTPCLVQRITNPDYGGSRATVSTTTIDPATLELCSEPVLKVKPKEFKDEWNKYPELPPITTMTGKRNRQLATRCKEPVFAGNWKNIILKMSLSPFLTGKKTNWHATVKWFLDNDENYVKVHEGNYDAEEAKGVEQRETSLDRLARVAKERE